MFKFMLKCLPCPPHRYSGCQHLSNYFHFIRFADLPLTNGLVLIRVWEAIGSVTLPRLRCERQRKQLRFVHGNGQRGAGSRSAFPGERASVANSNTAGTRSAGLSVQEAKGASGHKRAGLLGLSVRSTVGTTLISPSAPQDNTGSTPSHHGDTAAR